MHIFLYSRTLSLWFFLSSSTSFCICCLIRSASYFSLWTSYFLRSFKSKSYLSRIFFSYWSFNNICSCFYLSFSFSSSDCYFSEYMYSNSLFFSSYLAFLYKVTCFSNSSFIFAWFSFALYLMFSCSYLYWSTLNITMRFQLSSSGLIMAAPFSLMAREEEPFLFL